jgi:hypothetical protein
MRMADEDKAVKLLLDRNLPIIASNDIMTRGILKSVIPEHTNNQLPWHKRWLNNFYTRYLGAQFVEKTREPIPAFTMDSGVRQRPLPANYHELVMLWKTHWLLKQISRAITGEVINPGVSIAPRFKMRCPDCGREFDNPAVESCDVCDGTNLEKPDPAQFTELQRLLKEPSKGRPFKEFVRSTLEYFLSVDDAYWEIGRTRGVDPDTKKIISTPKTAVVLDSSITRPIVDEYGYFGSDEYFCPICYVQQRRETGRDPVVKLEKGQEIPNCEKCGEKLERTAYVQERVGSIGFVGSSGGTVISRFTEDEVVHISHSRISPAFYGQTKTVSILKHLFIIDAMDEYNLQIWSHGHVDQLVLLEGVDKSTIEEIEDHVGTTLSGKIRTDVRTGESRRSLEPAIIMVGIDQGKSVTTVKLMPDLSQLQSLDFYRLYVEKISGVYGVTPIFTNTTEAQPQGTFARPRIDVQNRVTRGYMQSIEEPFNDMLLPRFGITDWVISFGKIESRDEFRDAQKRQTNAATAVTLYQGGWDVILTPDLENIIVEPEPSRPPNIGGSRLRERPTDKPVPSRTTADGTSAGNPIIEPEVNEDA